MHTFRPIISFLFLSLLTFAINKSVPPATYGLTYASERPADLEGVGVTEHLGEQIKIAELQFNDELGNRLPFSTYFNQKKPVILALVYYKCPHLCGLVLNGLLESLKNLDWSPGNQFESVMVSIDPQETPALATEKKLNYLKKYDRPNSESGWHFLTGEENQIRSLASQVGFNYRYIEKEKQYSHAAVLFLLTPQGKVSRYLYGATFKPNDLRFGLLEAAQGRIGTVMDRVLLFCFHFDPNKNSYTLRMWRIVQLVICMQVLIGGTLLYKLWKGDRPKKVTPKQLK